MQRPETRLQLWLACSAMGFAFVTTSMISPLVPLFSLSLGASPAVVGFLVSAAFILPLFLAMPAGALVDRWGSRGLMTLGAASLALAPTFVVLWPSLIMLALLQVVAGLAHLILVVSAQSFVASLGSDRERVVNFGWYTTFLSGGQLIGPLLAGILADALGYTFAFGIAGAITLAAVGLSRFLRSATSNSIANPPSLFGNPGQLGRLLHNPGVKMALLVSTGVLFAMGAHQAFLPVYLDALAYPATAIGLFISLKALITMIVRPFMPGIIELLRGRARTMLVMVLMVALGLGITGFAASVPALVFVALLVGAGSGISQPLSMVAVADHVNDRERGFALGLRLTGNRVAQVFSPLLLGLIAELAGLRMTFLLGGLALVLASPLIARWGPAFERVEKAPENRAIPAEPSMPKRRG